MTLRAVGTEPPLADTDATSVLPMPLAASAGTPSAHDLRLFEPSAPNSAPNSASTGAHSVSATPVRFAPDGADGSAGPPPRRRRRGVLLGAAGAVVVVAVGAGYASGLFSYDSPSRDGALPDEVRASVPDPSADEVSAASETRAASSASASASSSPSASSSASASAGASASSSPSSSAASGSPSPSGSAEPTQSTTTTPADDAPQESGNDGPGPDGALTLHLGDQGPQVAELQQRLIKTHVYNGDVDGDYSRQVESSVRTFQWWRGIRSDEPGVYGPETRSRLEAETPEV